MPPGIGPNHKRGGTFGRIWLLHLDGTYESRVTPCRSWSTSSDVSIRQKHDHGSHHTCNAETDQPDHTNDDWKLLDKDKMDSNQLEPKPPFAYSTKLTPLPKDKEPRGDLVTKLLTNKEGGK